MRKIKSSICQITTCSYWWFGSDRVNKFGDWNSNLDMHNALSGYELGATVYNISINP